MMEPLNDSTTGKYIPLKSNLDVGKALREAREALGLNVHDVAERIKFAPKQVEALEANDFAHLPQATFLRGFVRSYARMLELDEAVLIAGLPSNEAPKPLGNQTPVESAQIPIPEMLRRVNVVWLAGALGVGLVLALFLSLPEDAVSTKPAEVVVESISLPVPASDVAAASSVAEAVAIEEEQPPVEVVKAREPKKTVVAEPKKTVAAEPKKAAVAEPKKAVVVEPKKVVEPVKPAKPSVKPEPKPDAASAPSATNNPEVSLEMLKRRPLHLVFLESAWAEVIDAHGSVLLSRTNSKGSEKWIGGPRRAPYDITLGGASNVKLYYKGKEVDLSAYAGMATARLKVE